MIARWNKFWFEDPNPYNPLGLIRVLAVLFWGSRLEQHLEFMRTSADLPPGFIAKVIGHRIVPLPYPLPEAFCHPLKVVLYIALFGALLGLFTRACLAITSLGAIYLGAGFAAANLYDHHLLLTLYVLAILTVAPGTTQLSLDALIKWWRADNRPPVRELASFTSGNTWGYKLILCVLATVYMTAGVSKLRYSGGHWLNGQTLGYYLSRTDNEQEYLGPRGTDTPHIHEGRIDLVDHAYGWGARPAVRPYATVTAFMALLSVATVALELMSPLLLAHPIARALYLLSAFMMHSSIDLSMDIGFFHYRVYALCLVDWAWFAAAARRRLNWQAAPTTADVAR